MFCLRVWSKNCPIAPSMKEELLSWEENRALLVGDGHSRPQGLHLHKPGVEQLTACKPGGRAVLQAHRIPIGTPGSVSTHGIPMSTSGSVGTHRIPISSSRSVGAHRIPISSSTSVGIHGISITIPRSVGAHGFPISTPGKPVQQEQVRRRQ